MKTLLKIFAVAAALGLTPAAVIAQAAQPAPASAAAATPAPAANTAASQQLKGAPPSDAISAESQARGGAQPQEISQPGVANPTGEEPSDATVAQATMASRTSPVVGIGQPDGRMSIQDQVTPIGRQAAWFHNVLLLPLIAAISLFVLALLLYVIVRYRRSAHPIPSRTTHNTLIEVVWTLVPVLILVAIAVPS